MSKIDYFICHGGC